MLLKPQDTLLALKYWSLNRAGQTVGVRTIAVDLGISPSEVSKGGKRLLTAHLAVERDGVMYAETGGLLEWLCYGVRYAYPQESVGYGRGLATAWNCPLLNSEMIPPDPALVWPVPGGQTEGALVKPIHDSIPHIAAQDSKLYPVLALLEAIRGGKPRELAIARKLLNELVKGQA
ncbi:MAG: hypothetical protein OEZ39_18285 [Gammaproteobacteria bacterium]|nr:hypothetical protein [Gammaproteobacteria bacterium]MDH5653816.1 hypothetical protein [Gammaproteobacteria bacterium]